MRTTQFIGLNDRAVKYIEKYSTDRQYGGDTLKDMFGNNYYECATFTHKNGRKFEEYLQCSPWSSGPMLFLALRYVSGNPILSSLWISDENVGEQEFDDETGRYWV